MLCECERQGCVGWGMEGWGEAADMGTQFQATRQLHRPPARPPIHPPPHPRPAHSPTGGSWSTSPTSTSWHLGRSASNSAAASGRLSMEASSTSTASAGRGLLLQQAGGRGGGGQTVSCACNRKFRSYSCCNGSSLKDSRARSGSGAKSGLRDRQYYRRASYAPHLVRVISQAPKSAPGV